VKRIIAVVAIVSCGIVLAACGGTTAAKDASGNAPSATQANGEPSWETTTTPTDPTTTTSSTTTPTTAPVAHVGATLALSGQNNEALSVIISSVVDPATGSDGLGPQDGTRLVAVDMTITNSGSTAVTGDANNDASIIGSDGQTYTSSFYPVTGCTDFDNGQYQLAPAGATTGCTTYQLPPGVTAAKVRYSPDSGFSSDFGEWVVP
jgi:hypothetical protein